MSPIESIFQEWCNLRLQIGFVRKPKLTNRRKILIQEALCDHSHEDILNVIRYIRFSQDNYAAFMRGDSERASNFTDCQNILRKSKLKDKIKRANNWDSATDSTPLQDVYIPFVIEDVV